MTLAHYEPVVALWQASPGVGLSAADEKAAIARYLQRNPGLSFVAVQQGVVVGAVLCGHDGRRGLIHHLAVTPACRRRGIGTALVQRCVASLQAQSIDKCHLFVFRDNEDAIAFWQTHSWEIRADIAIMSRWITETEA
ncbi:MAG: GNAT family N-acetyltransferase [Chloroflexi bacterium]|nr:GNAT family N-acetyltransferase [Chloroflexota bacterium]